jgi:putative ABC transport system permease protein
MLRSLLATLGVIIGVGAVISANGVLEGARKGFMDSFESLGANMVYVSPKAAKRGGRTVGIAQTLKISDVDAIREESKYIQTILPEVRRTGQIKRLNRNDSVMIVGTTPDFEESFNIELAYGRFFDAADVGRSSKVVVLGHKIADRLFKGAPAIDQPVKLGVTKTSGFRVIGVLEQKGQKGVYNIDELVLVPVTAAQRSFDKTKKIDIITAQAIDLGHQPGGRRDRDHEHHAGQRNRTDARDRRADGHGCARLGHPAAVPGRIQRHQLCRGGDGRVGRHGDLGLDDATEQ